MNIDSFVVDAAFNHVQKHFLLYTPHKKQRQFHAAGASAKERLFLAGNRTGKTYCGVAESVMHLTGYYPQWWIGKRFTRPIKAWAASVTTALTAEVLEKAYLEMIAEDLVIGVDRLRHSYKIDYKTGGYSELTFKSYEQGRKKFQAAKLDLVHLDEEPPRDIYVESLMRTMSTEVDNEGIVLLTMTPLLGLTDLILEFQETTIEREVINGSGVSEMSEMTEEVIKVDEGSIVNNRFYIQASWDDNPHLLDSAKETLSKSLKPHEKEARKHGIPSLGSGLVYPVSEVAVVVNPFVIPKHWGRVFGLDFGWINPTAALFAVIDRDNDVMYLTGEYYVSERTPQQHVYELKKLGADKINGVYDPAGEQSSQRDGGDLAQLYRDSGLRYLYKADNAKEEGIMKVLQRFQNGKLKIFNTLNNTLKEFRMYSRDEKGHVKKGNDHLMDCLRYIVMSGERLAKSDIQRNSTYHNRPSLKGIF
ncbi:terminase large subunit domain-containing protein [Caedibacter taeniospiralis]|uniref:Putative phage DNA packaging protein Gp2 n=1 Tax=Caedibacter taeniospiralis TaxID=28907 RepID=Q6TFG3_CAETA|nr:terminase family protein [Caedibacter taeniospiralis]AAR87096.1 putative phage DNA packaging protein Gp2 [Caedibacter taeniospiralis]